MPSPELFSGSPWLDACSPLYCKFDYFKIGQIEGEMFVFWNNCRGMSWNASWIFIVRQTFWKKKISFKKALHYFKKKGGLWIRISWNFLESGKLAKDFSKGLLMSYIWIYLHIYLWICAYLAIIDLILDALQKVAFVCLWLCWLLNSDD